MDIANVILQSLTLNEDFTRTALPYIKEEYFDQEFQKVTFDVIESFVQTYNKLPNVETILVDVEKHKGLTDTLYNEIVSFCEGWPETLHSTEWLISEGEAWCKDRALYNAVKKSAAALDDKPSRGNLPDLLSEALGVSFDSRVGMDYLLDSDEKWEHYTSKTSKMAFDLRLLNDMTDGGVPKKTLNLIMGGVHTGKTRMMCHFTAGFAAAGLNVLYITLEMSEFNIAQRIDANLLSIPIKKLKTLSKAQYDAASELAKKNTPGKIIIKEYPTGLGHAGHFRHTIRELEQKKNFKPDVIMVDYLNICASSRLKGSSSGELYSYAGAIAQELRGLGQEYDVPVFAGTQTRRSSWNASDLNMDDISESAAVVAICDFCIGLITDETLQQLNQQKVKILKNRYDDLELLTTGHLNYNNDYMRLSDAPRSASFAVPAPTVTGAGSFGTFKY